MATQQQKKAFKEVLKGTKISKAMIKAEYAPSTAASTGKLTRTKGWQELMEKHLPDSKLAKRHRELLNKNETIRKFDHELGQFVEEKTDEPDTQAVSKALDMAYKLKNYYPKDEGEQNNKTLVLVISGETAERYGLSTTRNPEAGS